MKNTIKFSIAGVVMASLFGSLASAQTAAQTTTADAAKTVQAPPKVYKSPRTPGSFSGNIGSTLKYTPGCKKFAYDIDAVKIQETYSRSVVEAEAAKVQSARANLRALDTCIRENAQRDIDFIYDLIVNSAGEETAVENTKLEKLVASFKTNFTRVSALPKKAEPAVPPFINTYALPTGRQFGLLSEGQVGTNTYKTGCGIYQFNITEEKLNTTTSKNVYNVLRDEIIATSDNVKKLRECRVSNVDTDYSDIAKSINAGTAAFYNPFANELENKLYAAERQLTIQREHFGTAPAAKPAVKAAPKTKAKKK